MAFLLRMTWLAAGVDRMPFWPMSSFLTPYAAPIFAISWTTSGFQYRPSPPTTRKEPVILCQSLLVAGVASGERQVKLTLYTFWDGLQNAGDKRFTVVWLLEDSGPLSKTRSGGLSACLVCTRPGSLEWHGMEWDKHAGKGHHTVRGEAVHTTYVPGFWSVKDAN